MASGSASSVFPDEAVGEDENQCFIEPAVIRHRYSRPLIALTGVSTLVVLTAGVSAFFLHRASIRRGAPTRAAAELDEVANSKHCHTAEPGESCHVDVQWAMHTGIVDHPEWYKMPCAWLKPTASFEEFQACVYKINETSCPLPCNPGGVKSQPITKTSDSDSDSEITTVEEHEQREHDHRRSAPCHITKRGEACYNEIVKQMLSDSELPGLSATSTFEEVQLALHEKGVDSTCPRPCSCHLVEKGETCHDHVEWAMKEGIKQRASWYIGLNANSSFAEVQAYLHKDAKGTCPLPCSEVTVKSVRKAAADLNLVPGIVHTEDAPTPTFAPPDIASMAHETENHCHTAVSGEKCFDSVIYAMHTGIYDHPEWYEGLDAFASFEEFQDHLFQHFPDLQCPRPCSCATAKLGDKCHTKVKWVLHEGIPRHPDWYPDLNEQSRWETVQARLHEDPNTTCHTPCTPKIWGTPSLFCVAVFRSEGYEVDLVKAQLDKGVGIFGCDEFAPLSDKQLDLSDAIQTLIIPPCEKVGVSKDGTAANTLVFMQAWNVIWKDTRYKAHDWVIKADPDAVIIIDRLRRHLAPHTGESVFIKNCMKFTGPGWPMMFGSLEAFSRQAMDMYFKGADRCQTELEWQVWGEDLFMGNCLSMLGAKSHFDGGIIGDNVCKGANCADGTTAVYHPFKSKDSWFKCYEEAMSAVFK